MEESLKPGDLVRLKSGGPVMTIDEINFTGAICKWFDGKKAEAKTFQVASLEKTEKPDNMPNII